MKIKPVAKAAKPKYPDKYEIDLNRALLYYRPKRWIKAPIVGITLTALMTASLSSCTISPELIKNASSNTQGIPLFERGEGTGYVGGVASSGLDFISEKDAYAIVSNELKKAGFTCEQGGDKIKNASIPATYPYGSDFDKTFEKKSVISGELDFDAQLVISDGYKIDIEFVSKEDYMAWSDPDVKWGSSVTQYDIKETAKELKDLYKNAAVFYDPLDEGVNGVPADEMKGMTQQQRSEYYNKKMTEKSRENLRLQVLDFIEWLKSIEAIQ